MGSVLPHSTSLFNAITLCLRRDGVTSHRPEYSWEVEADAACDFIGQIGTFVRGAATAGLFPDVPELRIVGAEPFARVDTLEKILRCGANNKLLGHVWTTGAWVSNTESVRAVLDRLSGTMHAVTLHVGADSVEELGLAPFDTLLHAIRESRLGLVIECCVRQGSRLPLELLGSEIVNNNSTFIRIVPPTEPTSEAANHSEYFLAAAQPYDRCAERFSLTLLPNGDVYPCLRGIGIEAMKLGSLSQQNAGDVLQRARESTSLARLRTEGPAHLFDLAQAAGEWCADAGFVDSCQLHANLLTKTSLARRGLLTLPQLGSE
jgi:hypothetical protein